MTYITLHRQTNTQGQQEVCLFVCLCMCILYVCVYDMYMICIVCICVYVQPCKHTYHLLFAVRKCVAVPALGKGYGIGGKPRGRVHGLGCLL